MEMISRPCPVCESTDTSNIFAEADFDLQKLGEFAFASRKIPEYMHYRQILCPVCNLLYASPIPESNTLAIAYHEAAFDSSEEAGFASRTYGNFLPEIGKQLPDLEGAIDIGTGEGSFLEQLLRCGFTRVVGVEPSTAPIAAASTRIRPLIKQGLFRVEDFAPNSFSLVTCFQTLEHLYDPRQMCQDAHTLLKKGGAVFFICHNHLALSAKILGTKSPIFDIEHLQLFSEKSARYLLKTNKFTNITTQVVFNCYPLHYWLKLFPLPIQFKRKLILLSKTFKIGNLPLYLPAGNLAVIGYKHS